MAKKKFSLDTILKILKKVIKIITFVIPVIEGVKKIIKEE